MKKAVMAAVIAICVLAVSGGVYAAYKWLQPGQVATETGNEKLAKYFDKSEDEVQIEENAEYRAALLGMVSGENLGQYLDEDSIDKKMTYIVTAVERKDGTAMTMEVSEIVVSPFIKGVRPMDFNIYSMDIGGASMIVKDGILYTLTECDDLEMFADKGVYLAVMDGPNMGQGYNYDEATGAITRNKDYDKLNLLFELELDKSKADSEKAQKYIDKIMNDMSSSDNDVDEP